MIGLDQIKEWLDSRDLGAALITDPVSIRYLTGLAIDPGERFLALAVGPRKSALVVPLLELESTAANASGIEVLAWTDSADPVSLVAEVVGPVGRLAVEKAHLTLAWSERVGGALSIEAWTDLGPEIRRLRSIKSPAELEHLAEAARLTDQVVEWALGALEVGLTELELAAMIDAKVAQLGGELSFPSLIQFGPHSALPHGRPTRRALALGDLSLLDLGVAWAGYKGDITRMAVVGEPEAEIVRLYQVVLAAHDRAVATVRAGVTAGDIDRAAREVIEDAGWGDRFIHRTGHGLGLETHEHPSLVADSGVALEASMVITIEPGVYLPGRGGVRIEDDVVVEVEGRRLLTRSNASLRVIQPN